MDFRSLLERSAIKAMKNNVNMVGVLLKKRGKQSEL